MGGIYVAHLFYIIEVKMRKAILIIILFIAANTLSAVDQIKIPLKIKSDENELYEFLQFGVHVNATDSVDRDLGEKILPPFPPPGGTLFAVMVFDNVIEDDPDPEIWSYKDFRQLPYSEEVSNRFYHEYKVFFWRGDGQELTFDWGDDFQQYIDSAFFQYYVADIEIFKADMKSTSSFTVENSEIRKAEIKVWYNITETSVDYVNDSKLFSVYPNPAAENINMISENELLDIKIIDLYGNEVMSKANPSNTLNVGDLSSGQYILVARSINNTFYYQKFIKL